MNNRINRSVAVLGYSDTGKTTFIETLVAAATQAGITTAIVKYSRHPGDFDRPGSDTERFRRTDARFVAYRSDERWIVSVPDPDDAAEAPVAPRNASRSIPQRERIPEWLTPLAAATDILILEGRALADSLIVLAAGDARRPEDLKYPPEVADLVITSHSALAAAVGPRAAGPTDAAHQIIAILQRKGGFQ